ncbi:MAG: hypothetical protein ACFB9N_16095 [Geitlerinemataceae cyanobacterium]
MTDLYYTLRVKQNGQYLSAAPDPDRPTRFVLLFPEAADALSYLDAHASGMGDRFAVETVGTAQLGKVLERWGFVGVGVVRDPRLPDIEFAARG